MTIRELIKKLKEHKIDVALDGNDLEINFEGDELPEDLIDEIRNNKTGIIQFLKEIYGVAAEPIPKVAPQASYELSSPQRRLWLVSQFEEANVAYNNTGAYIILGDLNMEAMRHACNALIDRHEILRTVLREDEQGELRQFILTREESGFNLVYKDLRGEQDPSAVVNQLLHSTAAEPMDLTKGPLLRVEIYHVSEGQWVLNYIMHHIVSDGWSAGVFSNDISTLYFAYLQGNRNPLPPLPIQYKDYAAWQQGQLSGEQLEIHKGYWMGQFEGELPILELTGDRPRPPVKTYNGQTTSKHMVSPALTKAIKGLAQEQGGTLFMGLLTTLNILLYRYTGQEDIIIGFPVAGRDHPDLENQIGFYINNLALRTRFSGNDTVRELLRKVKQVTLGAYEHQVYPFEELLENLDLERDLSRSPLFNIVTVLHNATDAATVANAGNMAESQPAAQQPQQIPPGYIALVEYPGDAQPVSKYDLTFNFGEVGDAMKIQLEYNTDLFNKDTIDRILIHLEQIMLAATAQPDTPVAQLNFLTAAETDQLIRGFNQTAVAYPSEETLVTLFEQQAAALPDHIAVWDGGIGLTYRQLNEQANLVAHYLIDVHQLQPEEVVAVKLPRSHWFVTAVWGILKAGGAYLPIDNDYPQERIDYMVSDSRCRLVVDEAVLQGFAQAHQQYSTNNPIAVAKPNHLAYIIYTSGSTGRPKGVMVEHRSIVNYCTFYQRHFAITPADRTTLYVGIGFDVSAMELFTSLTIGAGIYVVPPDIRMDAEALAAFFDQQAITMAFLPPHLAESFITLPVSSLRCLAVGGDKMGAYSPTHYRVENLYGPTETTVAVTTYTVTQSLPNIPIGKPIANTRAYILSDDHQNLCPVGVVGELFIAGDCVARGYLYQQELTAEKFLADPFHPGERMYRTGDRARWLPDGNIEFLGRKDGQVKVRGHRIELGEVEAVLRSYPSVASAVVTARTAADGEKELVAYIVGNETWEDAKGLAHFLLTQLPAYMVPTHFVPLEALPINANGKVDHKRLPAPENGLGLSLGAAYIAPRNETEEKLVSIWQEVLKRDKIGVQDNFFTIGGHSLKATKLISHIRKEFNVNLSLPVLFSHPTIEYIASEIDKTNWVNIEPEEMGDVDTISI